MSPSTSSSRPRNGKSTAGYEALPALDEEELASDHGEQLDGSRTLLDEQDDRDGDGDGGAATRGSNAGRQGPLDRSSEQQQQQQRTKRPAHGHHRTRSTTLSVASIGQAVDIRHLDAKLRQWTQTVSARFGAGRKRKAARDLSVPYEILASAFGNVEPRKERDSSLPIKTLDHKPPLPHSEFLVVVNSIKSAIALGVNPRLNRAGTSGSYFAKLPSGRTVGIFKPKNEEPYGSLNPKWSKWFHRHFLTPFVGFGRACLLPNFSYLSEAGASLLSVKLELHIVPPTDLVSLSSPAFFYDWIDRHAYQKKKRPLPEKIGSLQLFLDGYTDASDFLKEHPWPGRAARDTLDLQGTVNDRQRRRRRRRNCTTACRLLCGTAGVYDDEEDDSDNGGDSDAGGSDVDDRSPRLSAENLLAGTERMPFTWTQELMDDFRFELEKLVILDVLMRNTDRGLDNFMVKVCQGPCRRRPSAASLRRAAKETSEVKSGTSTPPQQPKAREGLSLHPPGGRLDGQSTPEDEPYTARPHVHIAAIDNSLSFPIHHPNSWRSYCYGWLFLPSSLIGRPFSQQTRDHFLPLLTDPKWWSQTVFDLRKLFETDEDFNDKMFLKQIGVLKGQAWNVVQSLRNSDEGPLELCRRRTCVVHDDEVVVADDEATKEMLAETARATVRSGDADDQHDNGTSYRPSMDRHMSASVGSLPPADRYEAASKPAYTRHSSERPTRSVASSRPISAQLSSNRPHLRPIPTSQYIDLSRPTFGSASGVSMMEHMERLQRREEDVSTMMDKALHPRLLRGSGKEAAGMGEEGGGEEEETLLPSSPSYGSTTHSRRSARQGVSMDFDRRTLGRDLEANEAVLGGSAGRSRSGSIDEVGARRVGRFDVSREDGSSVSQRGIGIGVAPAHTEFTKIVIVERVEEVDARPYFVRF